MLEPLVEPLCRGCVASTPTRRIYEPPRWNMFLTKQEGFEWADRHMAGKEAFACDFEAKPENKLYVSKSGQRRKTRRAIAKP